MRTWWIAIFGSTMIAGLLVIMLGGSAFADSFSAGRIIDDEIMTNSSTMGVNQIQAFLNSKVPVCDTSGTQSAADWGYPNLTHAQFATQIKGWPGPPYTCLKDYSENSLSTAQIILNASQQYQVNPQVLIVLLQKEQGLVTDTWPLPVQYKTATGYGCPDTAACDSQYFGLTNQILHAAYMYHAIMTQSPGWYSPYVVGNNYIQYSPVASCGGSTVYVQNWSTAALYDYTPYQPNAAALAAGYGTGDSCSASGNRNFYLYFTDWFGSTTGPRYSFVTATNPPSTILPNQIVTASITVKNNSGTTWYSDGNVPNGEHATRLATQWYANTPFANTADPAWLGTQNQIKMDQATVASGATASFTFTLRGPLGQINNYTMQFAPVLDGIGFYRYIGMQWTASSPSPNYSYQVTTAPSLPAVETSGTNEPVHVSIKNTGNVVWYSDKATNPVGARTTRLLTISPGYHPSIFYDPTTWLANNQLAINNTSPVNPGDTADISFSAHIPDINTNASDQFGLVIDGAQVLPVSTPITLTTSVSDYRYSLESSTIPAALAPGTTHTATVTLKNTGTKTWYSDTSLPIGEHPLRLATAGYGPYPYASRSAQEWLGTNNQIRLTTASVAPGQSGVFTLTLTAPYKASSNSLQFEPVVDGKYFLPTTFNATTTVSDMQDDYQTVAGTINPPATMAPGEIANVKLMIKNSTNYPWYSDGSTPPGLNGGSMRIIMTNPVYRSSPFANPQDQSWLGTNNQIKMVTSVVNPGEIGEFDFTWKAPSVTGTYSDSFNLVIDGYRILPYLGMNFTTTVR